MEPCRHCSKTPCAGLLPECLSAADGRGYADERRIEATEEPLFGPLDFSRRDLFAEPLFDDLPFLKRKDRR